MINEATEVKQLPKYRYFIEKRYHPKPSKAWRKNDEGVSKFYTYILKLNDGQFYAGHSRELRPRLCEHKDNTVTSTKGKEPKLEYFEILTTREAAMSREKELRDIINKNPREIRRMIIDFQNDIKAVDFE